MTLDCLVDLPCPSESESYDFLQVFGPPYLCLAHQSKGFVQWQDPIEALSRVQSPELEALFKEDLSRCCRLTFASCDRHAQELSFLEVELGKFMIRWVDQLHSFLQVFGRVHWNLHHLNLPMHSYTDFLLSLKVKLFQCKKLLICSQLCSDLAIDLMYRDLGEVSTCNVVL